jgi:hypothetical protein
LEVEIAYDIRKAIRGERADLAGLVSQPEDVRTLMGHLAHDIERGEADSKGRGFLTGSFPTS